MLERIETKASYSVDDTGAIKGIAWPFNGKPDKIGDMIDRGAINLSLPMPILFEHDRKQNVGVWTKATETDRGFEVEGQLLINDVARAREVYALVKHGALTGLSIGYISRKSFTRPTDRGRTIKSLDLHEVSLVSNPCHPDARVLSAKTASAAMALAEAINRAASALKGN